MIVKDHVVPKVNLPSWRHRLKKEWDGDGVKNAVRIPATYETTSLGYLSKIKHNS